MRKGASMVSGISLDMNGLPILGRVFVVVSSAKPLAQNKNIVKLKILILARCMIPSAVLLVMQ
jgi:hypothetical protein